MHVQLINIFYCDYKYEFKMLQNVFKVFFSGGASIARGMSLYIDSLTNKTMETAFRGLYEIELPYLSEYFDFFAMFIVLLFSGNKNLL